MNLRLSNPSIQCAWCQEIRWTYSWTKPGKWGHERRLEIFNYSHGICSDCQSTMFSEGQIAIRPDVQVG